MDNNKKQIPWWLVVVMLVSFWPVGVAMLLINVLGGADKSGASSRRQYRKGGYRFDENYVDVPYKSSNQEIGAEIPRSKSSFGVGAYSAFASLRKGKLLRGLGIAGTIFAMMVSSIVFIGCITDYYAIFEAMLNASIVFVAIGAPSLALAFWGNSVLGKAQRYRRYAQMIGGAQEISLDRLAGAMGLSYDRVCGDLYKMIDDGFFEGYYIDNERRVMTNTVLGATPPPEPRQEREKSAPAKEAEISPADRIRQINDTIVQPEVSEKIMRLETLTRRIYSYTDAYPQKDAYARSFKEKYLPKTIKILEAYSRFERSGSSGENVRAAMKDVEAVLDVLISSFEKQLDMLYMDEALDVTTDIDVLESMISGDGLGASPFATMEKEL